MITKSRSKSSNLSQGETAWIYPSVQSYSTSAAIAAKLNTVTELSKRREVSRLAALKLAPFYPAAYFGNGFEKISYSTNKPPKYNSCTHQYTQLVNYAFSSSYYKSAVKDQVYLASYYRRKDATVMSLSQVPTLDQHFSADVGNAQRTAWGTMQPRFEGDISMFNFILELKDFKSLGRMLLNHPLRKLSNFFVKTKNAMKKTSTYLRDYSKPIAETHLFNEFALKPLLSDVYKITCQLEELVADVQQKFSDAGRERSTRHYSEELFRNVVDNRSPSTISLMPYLHQGKIQTTVFNASMEYSYEYNMRGALDAFMKYWGVIPDAEAIWNAIPFSFIVDYFIKIGDSLRVAKRDSNVALNLSQYCESLKTVECNGICLNPSYLLAPAVLLSDTVGSTLLGRSGDLQVHGTRTQLYTRYLTMPNKGMALPKVTLPSYAQAENLLALARCFF